jgi:hypothetical protein
MPKYLLKIKQIILKELQLVTLNQVLLLLNGKVRSKTTI